MSTKTASASVTDLLPHVRAVFAEVTRYPLDILDPDASLEEDLGIDSVKLGEVFSVLRERYGMSEDVELPAEQLGSIGGISEALASYLVLQGSNGGGAAREAAGTSQPGASGPHPATLAIPLVPPQAVERNSASSTEALIDSVRSVFAEVTRYPFEILEPDASLEEDLGIDSVKLGEVFSLLRERYGMAEDVEVPPEQLGSIAGIAKAIGAYAASQESHSDSADSAAALSSGIQPANGDSTPAPVPAPPLPGVETRGASSGEALTESVRAVFAEVTRYPLEILEAEANLEEDLGIDSVKLGEVFSVLRERYGMAEDVEVPPEQLDSIAGISDAIGAYLASREAEGRGTVPHTTPAPSEAASLQGAGARTRPAAHTQVGVSDSYHGSNGVTADSVEGLPLGPRPLAGKITFVSGSGRGLGKDIACYLAELGSTVIVNSFHARLKGEETVEEIMAAGGEATHMWGSVANSGQLHAIFDEIESRYGGLDFCVSNASNGMLARLEDITPDHWERAFRTNVVGLHQVALRARALMKKRGGGKIITLSSPASHGYVDYFGCMGAVKSAVESLTKSMAIEFAPDNIQVNCVSPGPIYGELLERWPESDRLIAEWEAATVYPRLCEARDVSHFIGYLLSEPVKLFTGSVIVMDGGISVRWGLSSPSSSEGHPGAAVNGGAHGSIMPTGRGQ